MQIFQNRKHSSAPGGRVPLFFAVLSLLCCVACDPAGELSELSHELRESAHGEEGGAVAGKAGDLILHEGELFYANAAYGVSTPEDIAGLSDGARRLVIQKLLLRRLAIERGESEGYYSGDEAARWLAPRLDKLLEEYYYHRAAGLAGVYAEAERLKPDDEALRELMKTDPALKGKPITLEQVRAERDVLIRRIARRRAEIARQKAIDELLKSSPALEIPAQGPGALSQ